MNIRTGLGEYILQTHRVIIVACRYFKCSFEHVKSKFYCALNTLLHRARGASKLVSVQLFKSFCVPVISYALEAVSPNKSSIYMLDNLINRAVNYSYFSIFRNNIGLMVYK